MSETYESPKFKTSRGEGFCWTDNDFLRVSISEYGVEHVFRLHAEDISEFLRCFMMAMLFTFKNAGMEEHLERAVDAIESTKNKDRHDAH